MHDQVDSNQADKISAIDDEDDLIKTESQDAFQHKAYPAVNQVIYFYFYFYFYFYLTLN